MPASITLSGISWSTPDGRPLFSDLNLTFGPERTGLVGRNGTGKTTLLRIIAGELEPAAGSVAAELRQSVLRQVVDPPPGQTIADLFGVSAALELLERAENGTADLDQLSVADWTLTDRLEAALHRFGLDMPASTTLASLSGGQATRAALAALVFGEPDFLLLDEPTNNLDREGRQAVLSLLAGWRGGAVVVSHDRELLETMDAIVELTSLGATRYGGNWSAYQTRKTLELAAAEADLAEAERLKADLQRQRQASVERQARRDKAGRAKAAKGDLPRILLGARKNTSEATAGASARMAESRLRDALSAEREARQQIEILQPFRVELPPTGLGAGRPVLTLDRVYAGYLPDKPVIRNLSFSILGPERVALTGPNGSGKSTLLALVTGHLQPWSGKVSVAVPFAVLDQRVTLLDQSASIEENFRRLNPGASATDCRAALARFMFRADAALQKMATLSGGQLLRAGLACALGGPNPPQLVILDEPTNHLDIGSVETVEAGLRAYDGALLVVSHDERFLEAIGITRRLELGVLD